MALSQPVTIEETLQISLNALPTTLVSPTATIVVVPPTSAAPSPSTAVVTSTSTVLVTATTTLPVYQPTRLTLTNTSFSTSSSTPPALSLPPTSNHSENGLDAAQIVSLVVAILVLLLTAGALLLWIRRHRSSRADVEKKGLDAPPPLPTKDVLPGYMPAPAVPSAPQKPRPAPCTSPTSPMSPAFPTSPATAATPRSGAPWSPQSAGATTLVGAHAEDPFASAQDGPSKPIVPAVPFDYAALRRKYVGGTEVE